MSVKNYNPLVTVIVPTFNRRTWIGECLDSVLAQTHRNFEIIVVDDGSSDGTFEWLESEPRFASVRLMRQENSGASVARNNGIEASKGELITFIDSDDMLAPNHLERAVEAFGEFPDLGLFCCDSTMIGPDGAVILDGKTWHQNLEDYKHVTVSTGFRSLADVFSYSNCFPGFTLRKETFDELGGFIQSIFPADDYDLALRVAASRFRVYYLHEPLCLRREHDGMCSGIQNSVKTCRKLIEALEKAAVNDELKNDRAMVRERLSELELELAMSLMKEGESAAGLSTMMRSVVKTPRQLVRIAGIGGRRLKRMAGGK